MHDPNTSVTSLFDHIAHRYDKIINTLSLSYHKRWKKVLVQSLSAKSSDRILDIATGTGDIAHYLSLSTGCADKIIGCDLSMGMLKEAQKKNPQLTWIQCAAESLPFQDHSFDHIVICLAFRFMKHTEVLEECYRVLTPTGQLAILDTSPWPAPLRPLITLFDYTIGSLVSLYHLKQARIYKPMYASIKNNISAHHILTFITEAGFRLSSYTKMGLGSTSLYLLNKAETESMVARDRQAR